MGGTFFPGKPPQKSFRVKQSQPRNEESLESPPNALKCPSIINSFSKVIEEQFKKFRFSVGKRDENGSRLRNGSFLTCKCTHNTPKMTTNLTVHDADLSILLSKFTVILANLPVLLADLVVLLANFIVLLRQMLLRGGQLLRRLFQGPLRAVAFDALVLQLATLPLEPLRELGLLNNEL